MQGLIEHRDIFLDYPFGMVMPGRNWIAAGSADYGFGYQGNLNDKEINKNTYTTYFRELDTRLSRWWSIDSKIDVSESPYATNKNNPILFTDSKGDWPGNVNVGGLAIAGVSLSLSNSNKIALDFSGGLGLAMAGPRFGGEVNALANISLKPGTTENITGGFNLSVMGGVGNPLNMAGFATAGSGKGGTFPMSDFLPSAGNHITNTNDSQMNDFKGVGLRYSGSFINKENPNNISLVSRVSFGVLYDNYPYIGTGPLNDIDRQSTEFGLNISYSLDKQKAFSVEGSMFSSSSKLTSSGFFLNPISTTTVNTKSNLQIGVSSTNGQLSINSSYTIGGNNLRITGNTPSIGNVRLNYDFKAKHIKNYGISGSVGVGVSPVGSNVTHTQL